MKWAVEAKTAHLRVNEVIGCLLCNFENRNTQNPKLRGRVNAQKMVH